MRSTTGAGAGGFTVTGGGAGSGFGSGGSGTGTGRDAGAGAGAGAARPDVAGGSWPEAGVPPCCGCASAPGRSGLGGFATSGGGLCGGPAVRAGGRRVRRGLTRWRRRGVPKSDRGPGCGGSAVEGRRRPHRPAGVADERAIGHRGRRWHRPGRARAPRRRTRATGYRWRRPCAERRGRQIASGDVVGMTCIGPMARSSVLSPSRTPSSLSSLSPM